MTRGQKRVQLYQDDPRQAIIRQTRLEWIGKWVWFDPEDGSGVQKGLVSFINQLGEVYVSYSFDKRGCYALPVCTVDDIVQVLTLVVQE